MASIIAYYVHPGHRHSTVNKAMKANVDSLDWLTRVDLYQEYPRHNIDIEAEQARLLAHDVIVFQFPMFWYSTPSLLKEWQDLVLEYNFAYGPEGDKLKGKTMLLAVTAGGSVDDYTPGGRNGSSIRSLLLPLECTAQLCQMHFASPYVLFSSLASNNQSHVDAHITSYSKLLSALHTDSISTDQISETDTLSAQQVEQLVHTS